MPDTDIADATSLAERLRIAIGELAIPHPDSTAADHITVSFGGATLRPGSPESAVDLLKAADDNLYRAKHEGRNRVVWRENARQD